MASVSQRDVIDPESLREIDEVLLNYLGERCVTPAYCRLRMADQKEMEYTRGYVQERLAKLAEHGHASNLYDSGLYELQDDPRE